MERETCTGESKVSKIEHFKRVMGNSTIEIDNVEYSNKSMDLIGKGGYCKVKKDPTLKMERKLWQFLSKNNDLIPQTKLRQLIQHYSKQPHIDSLPKIPKDSILARPKNNDKDSNPNILSNDNCQASSQKLRQIIVHIYYYSYSYIKKYITPPHTTHEIY